MNRIADKEWGAHPPAHARGRDSVNMVLTNMLGTLNNLIETAECQNATLRLMSSTINRQARRIEELEELVRKGPNVYG